MTNASGIVWTADYSPFGQANVAVSIATNILRFAGQYFDSETGLHYNWNRYYDPSLGRYLRADPIGLEGGINIYSYVQNNPVNLLDFEGLKSVKDWYNDVKDAKDVIEKCKGLFDENGKFDCECGELIKCNDCAQTICEHYGPVGSPNFGFCIAPLQKICFDCGM